MPRRTEIYQQIPWDGGLNTSVDEAILDPNEVQKADNMTFKTTGARTKREGISLWDDGDTGSSEIIGMHDFWYVSSGVKTREFIAVAADGTIYSYDSSGTQTALTNSGTAPTSPTKANLVTFNNKLIISFDGSANTPLKYDPVASANVQDLGGSPPNFEFAREHLGRLWVNEKGDFDQLHYSATFDAETWNGAEDSGVLNIDEGDGDPEGLTGIFPPFKGALFVGKRRKLYKVEGQTPERFKITPSSDILGCIAHRSIVQIDDEAIVFASERGFHSLTATDQLADFPGSFISGDIQDTFDSLRNDTKDNIVGTYFPEINSVGWGVTETGDSLNNSIFWYNFPLKRWYRWPSVSCTAVATRSDNFERRFMIGRSDTRIAQAQNSLFVDELTTDQAIPLSVKTGFIYPDQNPRVTKGFKYLTLYIKPSGDFTVTVKFNVDNQPVQTLVYSIEENLDTLGNTFVLGQSKLGSDSFLFPISRPVVGFGQGCQFEISEIVSGNNVEIYGYAVEYEPADVWYETRSG
jgi:hypothetical protein